MQLVPKKAWFYWDAESPGPMSWLRRQSIETFKALNPAWEVEILSNCGPCAVRGNDTIAIVNRSDLARYEVLAEHGGAYFDTDIIFIRPIPEQWLEADVGMTLAASNEALSIGWLFSKPGSGLFAELAMRARRIAAESAVLGYQGLGVKIMWDMVRGQNFHAPQLHAGMYRVAANYGLSLRAIPHRSMAPIPWQDAELCWSPVTDGQAAASLGPEVVGLHWYGGDRVSETRQDEGAAHPQSPVARALAVVKVPA